MKYKMYSKKIIDKKIKELKKKYPEAEVDIGMRNDWFWTAESIDNSKNWEVLCGKYYRIGGIPGSYQDIPVLSIETEDGELIIPCYIEIDDDEEARKVWEENKKYLMLNF